jgi:hypothetical protein
LFCDKTTKKQGYKTCFSIHDIEFANMTSISAISTQPFYPFTETSNNYNRSDSSCTSNSQLTPEQEQEVEKLKEIDRKVRAHEAAHQAAAGGLARGGASFGYKTGPDGHRYAVSGEVNIDTSAISGDPQATLRKMQRVQQAALAPADPSGQDRKVAADAATTASEARQELAQKHSSFGKTSSKAAPKIYDASTNKSTTIDFFA